MSSARGATGLDAWLRARVLYVVSFLDLLAVSMIIPSLASYVKAMDGGASLASTISQELRVTPHTHSHPLSSIG